MCIFWKGWRHHWNKMTNEQFQHVSAWGVTMLLLTLTGKTKPCSWVKESKMLEQFQMGQLQNKQGQHAKDRPKQLPVTVSEKEKAREIQFEKPKLFFTHVVWHQVCICSGNQLTCSLSNCWKLEKKKASFFMWVRCRSQCLGAHMKANVFHWKAWKGDLSTCFHRQWACPYWMNMPCKCNKASSSNTSTWS